MYLTKEGLDAGCILFRHTFNKWNELVEVLWHQPKAETKSMSRFVKSRHVKKSMLKSIKAKGYISMIFLSPTYMATARHNKDKNTLNLKRNQKFGQNDLLYH